MGSCAPIAAVPAPDEQTPSAPLQVATTSSATKRKRRPAGTPDPEAEVVSLSPRTLLEQYRCACEICGQGFRREQNLVMHRRTHNLPWRFKKRDAAAPKRVFVCPETSCLYHQPSHALGDLTGIKKHFRRKHGAHRQWACARCSRAYAVHTDYKAHVKTCGTHSVCHCGRSFPRSRASAFVEHQETCSAARAQAGVAAAANVSSPSVCGVAAAAASSQQARSPCRSSPSSDSVPGFFRRFHDRASTPPSDARGGEPHNLELQLMPPSCYAATPRSPEAPISRADVATELRLSVGCCSGDYGGGEFRPSLFAGHVVEPRTQARP